MLCDKLEETGILPEPAAMEEEDVSPDVGLGAVSDRALPNIEPVDPVLAFKMKELDLLIKQEERETLLIKLRLVEADADQAFRLQQLKEQDLKNRPVPRARSRPPSATSSAAVPQSAHEVGADANFDISKNLKLVPPFRESEVDAYFVTFECIATKLNWPKDVWALFLQCSLTGKAQEVSSALPLEQSLDYDAVKAAVEGLRISAGGVQTIPIPY